MSTESQLHVLHNVVVDEKGCWLWRNVLRSAGYGATRFRGKKYLAHRFSYEAFVGDIPSGLCIDHLCRVKGCVNPQHLEAVTTRENVLRGIGLTARNARKEVCGRGHPYDDANTRLGPDGKRRCRICGRINQQAYLDRKMAA